MLLPISSGGNVISDATDAADPPKAHARSVDMNWGCRGLPPQPQLQRLAAEERLDAAHRFAAECHVEALIPVARVEVRIRIQDRLATFVRRRKIAVQQVIALSAVEHVAPDGADEEVVPVLAVECVASRPAE